MVADAVAPPGERERGALRPGPVWESFEQFRLVGARQFQNQRGENEVGWLTVKGQKFVIMRRATFLDLSGKAQDERRPSCVLRLVQQAVQLLIETHGSPLAVEHLRELAYSLPELQRPSSPEHRKLVFAPDEQADSGDDSEGEADFELDPTRVGRPVFHGPEGSE
jgi:hypothetical protein